MYYGQSINECNIVLLDNLHIKSRAVILIYSFADIPVHSMNILDIVHVKFYLLLARDPQLFTIQSDP